MNKRTEKKLSDLSGMNRAVNEILQQAWDRGRKYGNEEIKDIVRALQPAVEERPTTEEKPTADERVIEILTNYEKTACDNCRLRYCSFPCDLLIAVRYAITYMKQDNQRGAND